MRFLFSVITIVLVTLMNVLYAQSTQSGIVLEYDGNNKKKPLANVEIVVNNAGSTVSDAQGKFNLNFRTLKPGDKITVRRVEKLGYEVFNTEAVSQFTITRSNEPLTIIMCKTETIRGIRDRYSKIAQSRYAENLRKEEQNLKVRVNQGSMTQKEYEKKLKELQMNYEEQLENIDNYIEKFARIDLTELSELDQEIISLVREGKIDEAINKYDSEKLIDTYRSESKDFQVLADAEIKILEASEKKKNALDSIKNTIHRQIDLLWIAGGSENFEKIKSLLYDIAETDTTDIDTQLEYGDLVFAMENSNEAIKYYNRGFNAANGDVVKESISKIKRGKVYTKMNLLERALQESMSALHDLDSVMTARKDSDLFLIDRIDAQKNLGSIFTRLNMHGEAMRYYSYAILGTEVLLELDSIAPARDYAYLMMMYGKSLTAVQDTVQAEVYLKKAIEHGTKLWKISPQKYSANLADAYCWLGDLYRIKRKYALSENYLLKSSELYEYVCKINPDMYLGKSGECYQLLGKLYSWKNEYDKAELYLTKAEDIYSRLSYKNPYVYTDKLGELHIDKGALYWYQDKYELSAEQDSLAVIRYEEMYKLSSAGYFKELGQSIFYLGNCYFKMGRYREALECFKRAASYYPSEEFRTRLRLMNTFAKRRHILD